MKSLNQYKHWYLVTVTLLFSALEIVPRLALHLSGEVFRPRLYNGEFNINFSLYALTVDTIISCLVFSYINFAFREKLILSNYSNSKRWTLMSLINLGLLIFFVEAKAISFGFFYDISLPLKLHLVYFTKTLFILGIAELSTYILFLISKTKIIEFENLKLRRENMEAQYNSLKDQINPHFLFNTLNSLSSVIRSGEKEESLRFVDKMSEVYRYILESHEDKLISLSRELRFLEAYIFMLEKRFGNKFSFTNMLHGEHMTILVPPLALQILVENAVKHNKLSTNYPLEIRLFADNGYLIIENNLQPKQVEPGYGIGLANLRNRYRLLVHKEIEIYESKKTFVVKLPIAWS